MAGSVKVVGNYEIGQVIGEGAIGTVRECFEVKTRARYAAKVMDRKALTNKHLTMPVRREIAIMKYMKHPNIVQMMEVLQTKNNLYIIMEFVEGGDLLTKINATRGFDEEKSRFLFQELMCGVHYCHSWSVTHRDLKPENLLLSGDGHIKISDFGFSTVQDAGQKRHTVCGTSHYMAPEIVDGDGYDAFKADVWSSGVILYAMLCGKLPFLEKDIAKMFDKMKAKNFDRPSFLSKESADLIEHLLEPLPAKRYSVADIIAHPWFQKGFDSSKLIKGNVADPTENDMEKAIGDAQEDEVVGDQNPLGPM